MAKKKEFVTDVEVEPTSLKSGYLSDYISGALVKASPEEVQATQVFARRLVVERH